MPTHQWSLQDAKNKFSSVVEAARRGEAQVVTRRGVPTAVVISFDDFEKLQRLEECQAPSFVDHLLSMPTDDVEFERIPVIPREFA